MDDDGIKITFDTDLAALDTNATLEQFEKALARALRKFAAYLKTQSVRGLSKDLDVQQKVLRSRLKSFKVREVDGGGFKLFFGLANILYANLGTPKQETRGVRVGKRLVEGAFVGRDKNGKIHVWKRFGPRVPYEGGSPRYKGMMRQRLADQSLEIYPQASGWIERNLFENANFEDRFFKLFEHELRYAVDIEPRRNFFRG